MATEPSETTQLAHLRSTAGALFLLAALGCSSEPATNTQGGGGQPGGSAGAGTTAGAAGTGVAQGGSSSTAGSATGGSAISGMGGAGTGGGGAMAGTGGTSAGSGGGGSGNLPMHTGKSAGCGKDAMGALEGSFTNHRIAIPPCAACTIPNCPRDCVAPPFVPGGIDAQTAPNGETMIDRDFTIALPAGYDPNQPHVVFFGADGCGPAPPQKGQGFGVPGEDGAIRIGLQQVSPCFSDGGIRCAPDIKNVGDCVNGPEVPYFLTVQKWVEDNFCVDLGKEFIGGGSSGAWEAMLMGCATADTVRGFYSLAGGLREHRWACNGPVAAFMIVSATDTANPVGPLAKLNVDEDTYGAAPSRDEILKRNGCNGSGNAPYDAKYPECIKYTGCPDAYPVVWCEFPGGQHDNPNYNNVNYLNAVAPFLLGLPPEP